MPAVVVFPMSYQIHNKQTTKCGGEMNRQLLNRYINDPQYRTEPFVFPTAKMNPAARAILSIYLLICKYRLQYAVGSPRF